MEEHISKFVRKHLELLLLEREENFEIFFKDFSPASLYNLECSGQALSKLIITNLACKGPERFQIDFVRQDGLPLEHGLSSGDLVICIRSKEKKESIKAIVIEIGDSVLSISTSHLYENVDEEEIFTIIKTDSDFTYKAQTKALKFLEKNELQSRCCIQIARLLFDKDKEAVKDLLITEDPISKECYDNERNLKFENVNLAQDQRKAVEFSLKRRFLAVVQGPPGTGKTTTLIELIIQLHRQGKKILVCAPTNVAVDNLVIRLGETEAKPLRLGHPTRIAKEALKYSMDSYLEKDDGSLILKDIKKSIKDLEADIANSGATYKYREVKALKKEFRKRLSRLTTDVLKKCQVILCTLNSSSASDGLLQNVSNNHFDVLIVDEASQAMEASMWIAIPNAPKLVLAGDINQLPPVVMCQKAVDGGLNISLMERAVERLGKDCYVSLTKQYRMNEKIMMWSSKKFYENSLVADELVKNHLVKDLNSVKNDNNLANEAVVYVNTCGCECEEFNTGVEKSSKGNLGEAVIVDKIVAVLLKAGLPHSSIGIITPYSLQVDFIKRSFKSRSINVEVSTVDGFQGREKEVIILSLVRSNQDRELGFVTDFRRLNVAVTRARRLLVVVADSDTMEKDELIESLLSHIEDNGLIQTAEEYLNDTMDKEIEKIEKTTQNIKKSTKTISKVSKKITANSKDNESEAAGKMKVEKWTTKKYDFKIGERGEEHGGFENLKTFNVFTKIVSDQEEVDEDKSEEKKDRLIQKIDETESVDSIKSNNREKREEKNNEEGTEQKITEATVSNNKEDVEFNKLVEKFAKSNFICCFDGCKKSTKLIKCDCQFCKKWFCLEHGLQEIHGCGDAVRQKARKDFRHPKVKVEPCSRYDKNRFASKLKEMEEARKPKKKPKK